MRTTVLFMAILMLMAGCSEPELKVIPEYFCFKCEFDYREARCPHAEDALGLAPGHCEIWFNADSANWGSWKTDFYEIGNHTSSTSSNAVSKCDTTYRIETSVHGDIDYESHTVVVTYTQKTNFRIVECNN